MINGSMDSIPPEQSLLEDVDLEHGRKLFSQPCHFIIAASTIQSLPSIDVPEVAFAGRSNVGKSSLINALTKQKSLARTSITPGRTRELIFLDLDNQLRLVDLPGYGYARASKYKVAAWTKLIENYLRGRPNLRRVVLLIDSRTGIKESDESALNLLDQAGVATQIVITKADKINKLELDGVTDDISSKISNHPAAMPNFTVTSSKKGNGIPQLRGILGQIIK